MISARQRPLLDDGVLQRARVTLERRLAGASMTDPERGSVIEALLWIDRGVYGACSVCGDGLSAAHVERDPADKVCEGCRDVVAQQIAARHPVPSASTSASV